MIDGIPTVFRSDTLWLLHTAAGGPEPINNERHCHDRYELHLFCDGSAEYAVEDRLYTLHSGSALLITPFTYHCSLPYKRSPAYDRVVFTFARDAVAEELQPLLSQEKEWFVLRETEIAPLLTDAERFMRRCPRDARTIAALLLNRILLSLKNAPDELPEPRRNRTVGDIIAYVNARLNEPITTEDVAKHLFLSRSYVSHVFSAHMKIGLMDYVKHKKMQAAAHLLESGAAPTEVCAQLGYDDYSTFYRIFKRYMGRSPKAPS